MEVDALKASSDARQAPLQAQGLHASIALFLVALHDRVCTFKDATKQNVEKATLFQRDFQQIWRLLGVRRRSNKHQIELYQAHVSIQVVLT